MKITIITKNMLNGGAERVILNLINEWLKIDGMQVSLILMNDKQKIFYEIPKKCSLTVIKSDKKNYISEKADRFAELRKIVKKQQPDIVLSMPEEIGIYVILALLGTKVPVVVSERNNPRLMPYVKITRILRKLMYPFAKGLIFQTSQAASFFPKRQQKKGIVLPNPLNVENLPDPYIGQREKVIIGAGRLDKQKNFPLLIDAFTDFYKTHTDYKLVIYGEGSLRTELEKHAESKGLPKGTILLPGRDSRLAERLKTAAMFVLSSDFEGMPNVVIEAMAVGTPVISTDCPSGGSRELIQDGINGLLTPVGDSEKMTEAMVNIADDEEFAKKLSENSICIREKLDSKMISDKWMGYLKNVINKK